MPNLLKNSRDTKGNFWYVIIWAICLFWMEEEDKDLRLLGEESDRMGLTQSPHGKTLEGLEHGHLWDWSGRGQGGECLERPLGLPAAVAWSVCHIPQSSWLSRYSQLGLPGRTLMEGRKGNLLGNKYSLGISLDYAGVKNRVHTTIALIIRLFYFFPTKTYAKFEV